MVTSTDMQIRLAAVLFAITITLGSSAAFGQEPAPEPSSGPPDDTRFLSVTVSLVDLLIPVVELTGEFAVTPDIGVAGIVGAGSYTPEPPPGRIATQHQVFHLGAQGVYYAVGDFDHGLQLGAEALVMLASNDSPDGASTVTTQYYFVGPIIGYKFAASFGLTFFVQLGIQLRFITAQVPEDVNDTTDYRPGFYVPGNLNLGWSF